MAKQKEETILFGKFKLDRILGNGAFGKVYLATNLKTGESVAIKVISKKTLKSGSVWRTW
jgi:carbon catabolite-derepressing protein kinase